MLIFALWKEQLLNYRPVIEDEHAYYDQINQVVQLVLTQDIAFAKRGDFHYRYQGNAYTFEVGGPNKTADQIGHTEGFYTVVDDKATASSWRVPLWLFGLGY